MIFSKRLELAKKVNAWFDNADQTMNNIKGKRDALGVITALDALGYITEPLNKGNENVCATCNEKAWEELAEDEKEALENISKLQGEGHSYHCACRQVWGDGECECGLDGTL